MSDDDLLAHLRRLGLAPQEAEVYLAMLHTGRTTAADLAEHLGWKLGEAECSLGRLVDLGLAAAGDPGRSEATPVEPIIALDHLSHARSAELQQAHTAAVNAYRYYRRSVRPQATDDLVEAEVNDSLLVVRPSSLLSALAGLFETSWRSAFPMHLSDRVPTALRPMHVRILELLGTGVTDDTIAQLPGVSRRTLSRNLEQLNQRAGTVTRFQLAPYAARKGWI
ncbi:helix-turn-helix domain-containing protein [Nonomuraea sp. NPDC052265]|uniref:helix-turn-helix domain-containing protein n=1 Tax=Nonomuraea sp. NPDC052265 TaxID=3364374 RepID=UPI0037CC0F3C